MNKNLFIKNLYKICYSNNIMYLIYTFMNRPILKL
jgi:hypothetical protein